MHSRAISFTRLVITVPRLIAEAYASALVELGADAVEQSEDEPSATTEGADAGRNALPSDLTRLTIGFEADEPIEPWQKVAESLYRAFAEQLRLPLDAFALTTHHVVEDYHAKWLEQLAPVMLTEDILFVPTTCPVEALSGVRQLRFEPHPCFGDGSHPTTRLAAQATQHYCQSRTAATVLDVGTGNGVLALVAALCGAATVLGLDIEAIALDAARRNAELNQLQNVCKFSAQPLAYVDALFDWVVANLEPRTQLELLPAIAARVRPGGRLAISGFLDEQAAEIAAALPQLGFIELLATSDCGYACLCWERRIDVGISRETTE